MRLCEIFIPDGPQRRRATQVPQHHRRAGGVDAPDVEPCGPPSAAVRVECSAWLFSTLAGRVGAYPRAGRGVGDVAVRLAGAREGRTHGGRHGGVRRGRRVRRRVQRLQPLQAARLAGAVQAQQQQPHLRLRRRVSVSARGERQRRSCNERALRRCGSAALRASAARALRKRYSYRPYRSENMARRRQGGARRAPQEAPRPSLAPAQTAQPPASAPAHTQTLHTRYAARTVRAFAVPAHAARRRGRPAASLSAAPLLACMGT